ncbi:GlcG/HbpS family heme-binding protein [Ferviditalea candida]|uniref:Heme-binding protein n=1 Tax=Ferviditalea candida TaxID=3108399 RepID=A0ABU5ZC59_9BACL|nr:heme-binding protein [Paenibacillaceae bacterium T2]
MLTLKEAQIIAEKAVEKARSMGLPALSIAVLDESGQIKLLLKEDGATLLRNDIACGKAWGALAMGFSSRQLGLRFADRPQFMNSLISISGGKFVPVPGGVLIKKQGQVIGSVGVSGASSDEDELCAVEGIAAADFEAVI